MLCSFSFVFLRDVPLQTMLCPEPVVLFVLYFGSRGLEEWTGVLVTEYIYPILGSTARLAEGVVYGLGVITLEHSDFRLCIYRSPIAVYRKVSGVGVPSTSGLFPSPLKGQIKIGDLNATEM